MNWSMFIEHEKQLIRDVIFRKSIWLMIHLRCDREYLIIFIITTIIKGVREDGSECCSV